MPFEGPFASVTGLWGDVTTTAYVYNFDRVPHILAARGEGVRTVVWWFRPGGIVRDLIIKDNCIIFTRETESGACIGIIEPNRQMRFLDSLELDTPSSPKTLCEAMPVINLPASSYAPSTKKFKKDRKRQACPYALRSLGPLA
jgi:hypothetical protein